MKKAEEILMKMKSDDDEERRIALCEAASLPHDQAISIIINSLGDKSWRVRKQAIEIISYSDDPSIFIPHLIKALGRKGEVELRNASVEALIKIGKHDLDKLIAALRDDDPDVRKFIIDVLGELKEYKTVPYIIDALNDTDQNVVYAAAEALGRIGGKDAVDALIRVLKEGDLWIQHAALDALISLNAFIPEELTTSFLNNRILRKKAIELLGKHGTISSLGVILDLIKERSYGSMEIAIQACYNLYERLQNSEKQVARKRITEALGSIDRDIILPMIHSPVISIRKAVCRILGISSKIEFLGDMVKGVDDDMRETIIDAVKDMGDAAGPKLIEIFEMVDDIDKAFICTLLGELGYTAAEEFLIRNLSHSYGHVRREAAVALAKIGSERAIDHIFNLLNDRFEDVQVFALKALSMLAERYPEKIIKNITILYGSSHHILKRNLIRLIGKIKRDEMLEFLLLAIKDGYASIRKEAFNAIADLGYGAKVLNSLITALTDEDPDVRLTVINILGKIKDPRAVESLLLMLNDDNLWIRVAAIRSLGTIGGENVVEMLRNTLENSSGIELIACIESLGQIGDKRCAGALMPFLSHPDPEIVKTAFQSILKIGVPNVFPILESLINHENWSVRGTVISALEEIGGTEASLILEKRYPFETDDFLRKSIEKALLKIRHNSSDGQS